MTAIVPRALARVARPMLAACVMVCAPATALAQGSSWSWLSWDVGESFFPGVPQPQFLEQQLSFSRVRDARDEKRQQLITEFAERGLTYPAAGIYLRAFKRERVVEVWVRPLGRVHYTLFKAYPMCVLSGTLGPKRRQGDMQVPEGFYSLTYFNPTSEYYLSLGISYPNRADRVRENDDALGGDIFVHGGCRTIGCVPVTDDQMKEIYWLAVEARAAGQPEIPIHIFPTRLDEAGLDLLAAQFPGRRDLHEFWQNLHEGYHSFEQTLQVPLVAINRSGRYIFGEQAWLARLDAAETSAPLLGAPVDRQPPPPAPPGVTVWS
ncbi:MAG: L,D-transpeptidase family protein, partial [Longimicrobiales bacterium]